MITLKNISVVIGVLIGLGALWGGVTAYTSKFASASSVTVMRQEMQLMQKEYRQRFDSIDVKDKQNRAMFLDKRIWTIKQRYQYSTMDQTTKEMVRDLELELQQLRREGY